jgi:hypothetical protein
MKASLPDLLETNRVRTGPWGSTGAAGNNGMFRVAYGETGHTVRILASDGGGWEHVSVSIEGARRCPNWEEMCWVKDMFWTPEEWVMQFHPAASDYVNCHNYTLHLWRPVGEAFPTPPSIMVGPKKVHRH